MNPDARAGSVNGIDASTTRAFNRSVVLARIKSEGPTSRTAVAKSTRLAKATVSFMVDELIADGLVHEIGVGPITSKGGRPPILLAYNGRAELLLGVHVGVQHTTVVLATGSGEELARGSAATPRTSPESAIATVAELVIGVLADSKAELAEVVSMGVCLPGLIDSAHGVCLLAPNLGWHNVPVATLLTATLDQAPPMRIQNTTQAVALAEHLEGAGVGVQDMLLVYVGTGVGAAFLYDGALVGGATGIAGEIGHCAVPGGTRQCACGKIGCLETLVSAPGIVETVARDIAAGAVSAVGASGPVTTEEVARAARNGDAVCMRAVASAGRELGQVVSWAINLLNPSAVIVAGAMSDMGELLLRPLRSAVGQGTLPESHSAVAIRRAELGQEAKIRGAVLTARRHWEKANAPSLRR